MKTPSTKRKRVQARVEGVPAARMDPRAAKILKSLRNARKQAIATARLHGTPIIYLRDGKLVREYP